MTIDSMEIVMINFEVRKRNDLWIICGERKSVMNMEGELPHPTIYVQENSPSILTAGFLSPQMIHRMENSLQENS